MSFKKKNRIKKEALQVGEAGVYHYEHLDFNNYLSSNDNEFHEEQQQSSFTFKKSRLLKYTVGILFGLAYFFYVSNLFESVTKFSLLSNLEREISLPPDLAFRYSFYKRIAESETFLKGLGSILHDREGNKTNICPTTNSLNPFRKYSLSPEVVHGFTFHLLKKFEIWTRRKFFSCYSKEQHKSFSTTTSKHSFNSRLERRSRTKEDHEHDDEEGEGVAGNEIEIEHGKTDCNRNESLSGFQSTRNIFYFYLKSVWSIESFIIILMFHFGTKFSKSIYGGGVAVILFIILHPQRGASEWLFSFQHKVEYAAFFIQMYVISSTVLRKSYPSWTAAVKVAISTTLVILASQKEAQWLLISQILIITCMEFLGVVNSYIASLIIFGHLTGWQYATMITLNISFTQCSLFLYVMASCAITIHLIQPAADKILISLFGHQRLSIFIRTTFLFSCMQIFLYTIWFNAKTFLGIPVDNRLPAPAFMDSLLNYSSQIKLEEQLRSEFGLRPLDISYNDEEGENNNNDTIQTSSSTQMAFQNFLYACYYPTFTYTWDTFVNKYALHLIIGIYVIIITFIIPTYKAIQVSSSNNSNIKPSTIFPEEEVKEDFPKVWDASDEIKHEEEEEDKCLSSVAGGPFNSSVSSELMSELLIFKQNIPLITFNVCQFSTFIIFSIYLGKSWELLFIFQLCLLCSLFCDQKRISLVFGRSLYSSKKSLAENKLLLHWMIVFAIILTLFAKTKLCSKEMLQNSRAKFEIGNRRIQHLTESFHWIEENTNFNDSCFIGLEIPLLYLHLSTERACLFQNNHYEDLLPILNSFWWNKFNRRNQTGQEFNISSVVEKVYTMFSRKSSIQEYYDKLKVLNVTHLFLSRHSCTQGTRHFMNSDRHPSSLSSNPSTFSFLWELSKEEDIGINFRRVCDLSNLWNSIESPNEIPSSSIRTTKKSKIKSSISVKGSLKNKNQFINNKLKEKEKSFKVVQQSEANDAYNEAVVIDAEESQEDDDNNDILCLRLLNEPDVRPFKKVFENHDYTILAFSVKDEKKKLKKKKKKNS